MFSDDIHRDAITYLRHKDMLNFVTKETLQELYQYVEREFAAIPIPIIFVNVQKGNV